MKKITFSLLIGLLCFNLYSQVDLEDGLIAFYPFNTNANDESTNSNNGTIVGASLTFDRFNNINGAYNFDGNDYITIADSPSLRPTNFSISLWCKFDNLSGLQLMIDKHLGSGDLDSYEIWYQSNKVWGTVSDFSGFDNFADATLNPVINTWYHIVYVFDDSNDIQSLYIDSALESTIMANKSIAYDNEPLLIGASNDQQVPKFFFKGDLDDIRIYNRVINQDEINSLYSETLSTEEFKTEIFSIHPNPTSDIIKINSNQEIEEIVVFSLNGQTILKQFVNKKTHQINLENVANGNYIISVKIKSEKDVIFQRKIFIKQ